MMRCGDCKFYMFRDAEGLPIEQCRRHAPSTYPAMRFTHTELVRDIAWSLRAIAEIEPPDDPRDDLNIEATEQTDSGERWPYADEDDWCGEFQPK
jgi:hypothetical protein